jgi:hypothetical protein
MDVFYFYLFNIAFLIGKLIRKIIKSLNKNENGHIKNLCSTLLEVLYARTSHQLVLLCNTEKIGGGNGE